MVSLLSYRLSGQVAGVLGRAEKKEKCGKAEARGPENSLPHRFLLCLKERKKENCQAKGGMGGRHAATTQVFCRRALSRPSSVL